MTINNFRDHRHDVFKKVSRMVGILRRLKRILSQSAPNYFNINQQLCGHTLAPWYGIFVRHLTVVKLKRLQKRALRLVL